MTWRRIAGNICGDGKGRGHTPVTESEDEEHSIMNFNADPEDEINQDYSVMDADDPPGDVTPANFCTPLLQSTNQRFRGSKYATRTSIPNTGLTALPRQSRRT